MPVITAMSPESVHLGDKHIGALLAGDKLVYNRVEEWRKTTPGTLGMDIPEWASFMSILISGGGASGGYDATSNWVGGGGGGGGQLRLLTVDLVENPGTRASVTVGSGGRALTSRRASGNNGGLTRFNGWNPQSTWTANGGTPITTGNNRDGGDDGWNSLPENEARYLNRAPGSRYRPQSGGSAGDLSANDGQMGGGGGMLRSTLGGRRSGAGGDGFAIIHFFGVDPTTTRLTGGSSTPPQPDPEPPVYENPLDRREDTPAPEPEPRPEPEPEPEPENNDSQHTGDPMDYPVRNSDGKYRRGDIVRVDVVTDNGSGWAFYEYISETGANPDPVWDGNVNWKYLGVIEN